MGVPECGVGHADGEVDGSGQGLDTGNGEEPTQKGCDDCCTCENCEAANTTPGEEDL